MEGFEGFLKMVLKEKEKQSFEEPRGHLSYIYFKQAQAIQEAIDKGPVTPIEELLKEIRNKQNQMDQRFSNIERFISENIPLRVIEGDKKQAST